MMTRGETVHSAPKEQARLSVNLSGKKTLVGRNSGECFRYQETTKGESRSSVNFQVQGQRKLLYEKGFFCPFFMG